VLAGAVAAAAAVLVLAVGVLGDLGSDETDVAGVQVSATTAESAEDEQPAMTTMATAATTAALETNTAAAMDEEGSYADAARVEQAESALAGSDAYLAEPADGPTVDLLPADDSLDVEAWARDDLGTDLDGTPCPVDAMADLLGQPVLAAGPLDPDAPDGLWVYAGADRRLVADSVDCSWVYLTEPPDPDGP